jgi:SAM-dependent methyltransferase
MPVGTATPSEAQVLETQKVLRALFARYQTAHLKTVAPEELRQNLASRIGTIDAQAEGYALDELERQRDLSIKFHWGHDHDFGDFKLEGRMGERHILLLANFLTLFPVTLEDFREKAVLDVGCWTGGTTLLLATLAKQVLALEEVKKYAETVSYLAAAFGVDDRISARAISLYGCNSPEYFDRFDVVYFPGVIYHLSDPLLALRILFNALKIGGLLLVESAGIDAAEPICRFDGSLLATDGSRERLNRGGWNWFMPSAPALARMMKEAGFDEIRSLWHPSLGRVYGYGKKLAQTPICKAGLSVPDIR